jgi:hypothetical protein
MKNLFFALGRCLIGVTFGDRRRVYQTGFTALCVVFAPSVKARPANPKITACLGNISDLLSISKYPQFTLNLALILGHRTSP